MKTKLCLSLAFATVLMSSSFSAFADAPQKFKVHHNADHKADHSDAEGVTTLWTAQQFKMMGKKMIPVGDPKTGVHVGAIDKMHADNPDIANDALNALKDDPATLSIFTTLGTLASKVIGKVITVGSSLLGKPAVQDALLGGGIGIAASVVGGLAGGAAQAVTAPPAPAPVQ
jgi:hypothetical protein